MSNWMCEWVTLNARQVLSNKEQAFVCNVLHKKGGNSSRRRCHRKTPDEVGRNICMR